MGERAAISTRYPRQVFHHQRLVRGPHAHARRPRRPSSRVRGKSTTPSAATRISGSTKATASRAAACPSLLRPTLHHPAAQHRRRRPPDRSTRAASSRPRPEEWGWSMMDFNSLGRLTCLSPRPGRMAGPIWPAVPAQSPPAAPETWVSPRHRSRDAARAPLFHRTTASMALHSTRSGSGSHVPGCAGKMHRLRSGPAICVSKSNGRSMLRPSLSRITQHLITQRAIGLVSAPLVTLDASGLVEASIAAASARLVGSPFRWIGVRRVTDGFRIAWHDQQTRPNA